MPSSTPKDDTRPDQTYYITTPIYYVNDRPHIGHCYTTTVADVAARYQRMIGRDVFFLTGTDEHGQKVEKSAAAKGVTPQALADENAAFFRGAMDTIGASYDDFIRTTEPRHTKQVQAAFMRLVKSGDIELGTFEGWYDEGQEEYVTENQAREKNYIAFNGQPLKRASETNYYFRLDKYQARLEKFYEAHPNFVKPHARFNEVRGRLKDGLQKVPVSRTNFSWGIPVPSEGPGGPGHVIYVWIDALLNYATALGVIDAQAAKGAGVDISRKKYWPADVHLVGKEILWFHAVIWPAVLMALGYKDEELPKCIYAHSFWIADGKKMSKTLGNFIDLPTLHAYADRYSLDAVRWYLLTQGPLNETDADFSYAKFVEVYNADLANTFGNSCNRVGNMIEKYFEGKVPDPTSASYPPAVAPTTGSYCFEHLCSRYPESAVQDVNGFSIPGALYLGMGLVKEVDAYINATEPFKVAKLLDTDPTAKERLALILYRCIQTLRVASLLLHPAMPNKTAQLWRYWNCSPLNDPNDTRSGFKAPLSELAVFGGAHALKPGQTIVKGDPLFMRADGKEPAPVAAAAQ